MTVGPPVQLSVSGGGPLNPNGSAVAVDGNGKVNVAWYRNNTIEFRQCDATLSPCAAAVTVSGVSTVSSAGSTLRVRADSYPRLALDAGPSGTNRIYVVYASRNGSGFSNIFIRNATNSLSGVGPFSSAVTVVGGNTDAFMPSVAIDGQHYVHVSYYQMSTGNNYNVFTATSTDSGSTWSTPQRLNRFADKPISTESPIPGTTLYFIGDYMGSDGYSGVLSVWSDDAPLDTYSAQLDCGTADADHDGIPDLCDKCPVMVGQCGGDCGCDGAVTVDEAVKMVNIVLGSADIITCPQGDINRDGLVTVDEVVQAVGYALGSCPTGGAALASGAGGQAIAFSGTVTQQIGSASGSRGSNITIPVTLTGGTGIVSATQLDILYPTAVLINPVCVKDARLTNHSLSTSFPVRPAAPTGKTRYRTVLSDVGGATTFADGQIFSCTFTINSTATPGTYTISGDKQRVSDGAGNALSSTFVNGSVTVN